jgi:hypothetical protein
MAKPRIFLSSTFYDLRQIRLDLDRFIKDMGYEAVRNEQGNIPYGKDEKLEEYCYKEISSVDILVLIIGGKFGTSSTHGDYSITQMEMKTALELDKQVFVFIEKGVYSEFRTYLANKANQNIIYCYIDNPKIYEFIEQIEGLPKNNPIHAFESSEDIIHFLTEQWAGLFQRFLQEQRRIKEINLLQGLENTASTLNQLINYLSADRKGAEGAIRDILLSDHPAFEKIKLLLSIPYRVFFLSREELTVWLKARNYERVDRAKWSSKYEEEWASTKVKDKMSVLKINTVLFDGLGNLKPMKKDEWIDENIRLEVTESKSQPKDEPVDDLPF